MTSGTHGLFEVWGVEIECMIVDADTLDVLPIADQVLRQESEGGEEWVEDVEDGDIGWSNELVSHVLELKNIVPTANLGALVLPFECSVQRLGHAVRKLGGRLMPGGMHPWMQPARGTRIWPHESGPIYRAYDRLFDCSRHGWANLQSVHLNLPFADEYEFGRLMAAVRLVLPLIPALAASSPIVEGRATGLLDNRLAFYRSNAKRVPTMTGAVIPEPVFDFDGYHAEVLASITRELEGLGADPLLLGREWTNARGAIARFDRMAIEIRLIDAQECPYADLAVCAAVGGAVRALVEERGQSFRAQRQWPTATLRELLDRCIERGPRATLDPRFVEAFGADSEHIRTAGRLWSWLVERSFVGSSSQRAHIDYLLRKGTLAQRILAALGPTFGLDALRRTYGRLCDCLAAGMTYRP